MDLSKYHEDKPNRNKRLIWLFINQTIFRLLIGRFFRKTRIRLLRAFGASIPLNALVYHSANIFAPWKLRMGDYSCIGPNVEVYNKADISIGAHSVISQNSRLFTASHNISSRHNHLVCQPIIIEDKAWVAAEAFICMGVTIGEGAVVGARAAVFKSVNPWTVVGGNPAKFIKKRVIVED